MTLKQQNTLRLVHGPNHVKAQFEPNQVGITKANWRKALKIIRLVHNQVKGIRHSIKATKQITKQKNGRYTPLEASTQTQTNISNHAKCTRVKHVRAQRPDHPH